MKSIKFEKYFTLLDSLMPVASGFVVCDAKGMVIALHSNPPGIAVGDYLHATPCAQGSDGQQPGNVNILTSPEGQVLIRRGTLK